MIFQAFISGAPSKSDLARRKLLQAGLELFGQKGPAGATVREIARAAGQNVAAIAYYFGNKKKLYHAVLEAVIAEMRSRMADVFAEIAALQQQPSHSPAEAGRLLSRFLIQVYLRLLSRNEAVAVGRLVVREQLHPSSGFDTLYRHGFAPLHEALSFLVGTRLGLDPKSRETIVRTNAIMGQVYFFMMCREATLRRLGWKDLEGQHAEFVTAILAEHVETVLAGLSALRASSTQPRRNPAA
jgi:TetR/AcrR family transcriptional regulator, regulator of cefoperazone and chloramphenicol sensitivity